MAFLSFFLSSLVSFLLIILLNFRLSSAVQRCSIIRLVLTICLRVCWIWDIPIQKSVSHWRMDLQHQKIWRQQLKQKQIKHEFFCRMRNIRVWSSETRMTKRAHKQQKETVDEVENAHAKETTDHDDDVSPSSKKKVNSIEVRQINIIRLVWRRYVINTMVRYVWMFRPCVYLCVLLLFWVYYHALRNETITNRNDKTKRASEWVSKQTNVESHSFQERAGRANRNVCLHKIALKLKGIDQYPYGFC